MRFALPLVSASFMTGIWLARFWPLPLSWLAAAVALAAGIAILSVYQKRTAVPVLLLLFLLLGMCALNIAEAGVHGSLAPYIDREAVLSGYLQHLEDMSDDGAAFLLRVQTVALPGERERRVNALVRVRVWRPPAGLDLVYGRRLQLSGVVSSPPGRRNDGGFDYSSFLETTGAGAVVFVQGKDMALLPGYGGFPWLRAAESARHKILEAVNLHLPPGEAGLAAALLLGDSRYLQDGTAQSYRILGIAHLLAASGLHLGFVAAFALLAVRRLRVRFPHEIPVILFVLSYVLVTGGRVPVWRAAIMLGAALASRLWHREGEGEGLQGLAAASLLLLFFRPFWLFSLSFQFSFMATLGIILLVPRIYEHFSRLPSVLSGALSVVLAAQLAVLPLQVTYFFSIPLLAIPVNLLSIPLVGLYIALGLAGALAAFISLPLAAPFYLAALPVLFVLEKVPLLLAQLPLASVKVNPPYPAGWLFYFVLLGFAVLRTGCPPRRGARVALSFLLILNLICWGGLGRSAGRGLLEATFLDVGQGLSVYIRTPEGRSVLIDAGGGGDGSFDAGERIVLPYLRQQGVRELDLLILTHPHADHYGGMQAVAGGLTVRRFAWNGESEDSQPFSRLITALESAAVPAVTLSAGDRIILDGATTLEVLSPPQRQFRYTGDDSNNNSLVLRLVNQNFSLLVTGDAEQEALAWLLREKSVARLNTVVLHVPHHGSRNAMLPSLLAFAHPEAAVVSVGRNPFGHPHGDTIDQLASAGVTVYRTDLHGAVTFTSDGLTWQARSYLTSAANL